MKKLQQQHLKHFWQNSFNDDMNIEIKKQSSKDFSLLLCLAQGKLELNLCAIFGMIENNLID
jgi:hypothetical protein